MEKEIFEKWKRGNKKKSGADIFKIEKTGSKRPVLICV